MLRRDSDKNEALVNYQDIVFGKVLGSGGFGEVYHGTWRHSDVAIKKLLMKQITAESAKEFEAESQIMARLRFPNIVQFYGYAIEPERCIVMEYCPNGSLYSVLHSKQPLEWTVRIKIALGAAKGLAFLHEEKILHRDIKSLNILLTEHFEAKLTDFGLSKLKTESRSKSSAHQSSKEAVGTLRWMAPELFGRGAIFTQKSDIYSLGITFWELASRQIPFSDALDNSLVKDWVKEGEREAIPQDCPPAFGSLIQQCWEGEPSVRPDTNTIITRLKNSLEGFSAEKVSSVPSPNPSPNPSPYPTPSEPQYLNNFASENAPKPLVFSAQPMQLNLKDPLLKTLNEHRDSITSALLLPNGELASSSADHTIKVWDLRSGKCLRTLLGHTDAVVHLRLLDSGELLSGSADKTLKIWDLRTGTCIKTLSGHTDTTWCTQPLPNGQLVSGSKDMTLKIWDLKKGKCLKTLKGHTKAVVYLQLLPSGELASSPWHGDHIIRIWDLKKGRCLKTLEGHSMSISCLQALPTGELMSASLDSTIKIWDIKSGKCLKTIQQQNPISFPYQLLSNDELVASSNYSTGADIVILNLKTGERLTSWHAHAQHISAIQVLQNGNIASGSGDNTIKIWDIKSGKCLKTLEGHTKLIRCFESLPTGELVSGSLDNTIKLWDLSEFIPVSTPENKRGYSQ